MELKEKLVALRKEKGLTQLAVAEKLNVSRQAISRWESGIALPSTDNLKSLSALYGVPVDYLLNSDTEEQSVTYTVMPGSGYYKVKENTSSVTRGMNDSSEKTVYVGTANQGGASLAATNSSDYKYWGTVSYYNQFLNETYKIRCTIKEDVDTDGRFSPKAYYAEKAAFIANIVAFFVWPTKSPLEKAADKIFKNAIEKALFVEVVGDLGEVIKYELKKKFTVDATYISYRIKGVGITGNPSGEFESRDGYKATVSASDGLFNKTTYTGIWTKDDWRNPTMGRLMFWAVYGNEYSPTEWNP